jgi:hypothetical protein
VPTTWQELLTAAQTIKDAGYIPFANASGDAWTIAEIVFMNLAPTFIGGYEGRQAYLSGERCFNDESMVNAFQAVADLGPFVPEGQSGADLLRQPAALPDGPGCHVAGRLLGHSRCSRAKRRTSSGASSASRRRKGRSSAS